MAEANDSIKPSLGRLSVEASIDIRKQDIDDFFDDIIEVEQDAWPPELRASRGKFKSRLEVFPQGFSVVKVRGKIKGISTSQITNYPSSSKTWNEITDNGFIKKTHNPSGNALYVVSIGVARDTQGMGIGSLLLDAQKKLTVKLGLPYLFLGARIPGYDRYCRNNEEISIREYVNLKNDKGEPFDPEIRFYDRSGLTMSKIVPNFEPDESSRNYGAVMVWENK